MKAFKHILVLILAAAVSDIAAQCYPDRHSTNFFDGWLSCETAPSPNPARPASHFILYDFEKVYALNRMKLWNTNDPSRLNDGLREVAIDVSVDGQSWTHVGNYTLERASGLSIYEGFDGPDLGGAEGRYLLITGLSNYGGECFGLSEMRVAGEEVIISDVTTPDQLECITVNLYPNPFSDQVALGLSPDCAGLMRYSLYDQQGKMLDNRAFDVAPGRQFTHTLGADLPAGTYMLYLEFEGKSIRRTLVKMNRS